MSTTNETLDKAYDPKSVETRWYSTWENAGYFQPGSDGDPYTIVIPPPNVTGSLHMGHALNSTLQDVLIRYQKMNAKSALWVPGTDHGGIATQNVVEKMLKKEGTSRHIMGREKFLERMWTWRASTGDTILSQLRTLGATLDWNRVRFTMDEVCSRAVRKAFVDLYNKKLLYRGKRLVNWCPRCSTALADIEVEHKDVKGSLWHIRYPFTDGSGYLTVATTRPETLLGDTAVAVHPEDERYLNLLNKKLSLPLTSRVIPLVIDSAIDPKFGSGAVKVTPAHDPTDFDIGERHNLAHITVIGFDGKMTADAGERYKGLDRIIARKTVVADLEAQGLIEKVEDHKLAVSICYRCEEIIEPLESEQWFLSMRLMADRAIEANKSGRVRIIPESWEHPYRLWLEKIRDWCVSRQIWWGHRIPVWTCQSTNACPLIVSETDPTSCPTCGGVNLIQDPDVLDTWFSSALWPFSVFGWPEENADLKRFFPTSTLVTGHEILYLWVARMIMFALEFRNDVPFKTVLIHGIVRDKQGRKMSKSLGNVIDPLELIRDYGADAMRFSLAQSATPGRDMHIAPDNFISARNFANKIWNATRFVLMNVPTAERIEAIDTSNLDLSDQWILDRCEETIQKTTEFMNRFDMSAAARGLYDFFWSDFCDWYLEMAKPRFQNSEENKIVSSVLVHVLETTLRLLHPFMPFITEELWHRLPQRSGCAAHLMVSSWPRENRDYRFPKGRENMAILQEIVSKLRTIRSEMGILPSQPISVKVESRDEKLVQLIRKQEAILRSLNTRVSQMTIDVSLSRPTASASAIIPGANIYVPLEGLIDFSKEKARLEKELGMVLADTDRMSKKLDNPDFVTRAPEEEISKAKQRLSDAFERAKRLKDNIAALQ